MNSGISFITVVATCTPPAVRAPSTLTPVSSQMTDSETIGATPGAPIAGNRFDRYATPPVAMAALPVQTLIQ